jgi:hypothetical protein
MSFEVSSDQPRGGRDIRAAQAPSSRSRRPRPSGSPDFTPRDVKQTSKDTGHVALTWEAAFRSNALQRPAASRVQKQPREPALPGSKLDTAIRTCWCPGAGAFRCLCGGCLFKACGTDVDLEQNLAIRTLWTGMQRLRPVSPWTPQFATGHEQSQPGRSKFMSQIADERQLSGVKSRASTGSIQPETDRAACLKRSVGSGERHLDYCRSPGSGFTSGGLWPSTACQYRCNRGL